MGSRTLTVKRLYFPKMSGFNCLLALPQGLLSAFKRKLGKVTVHNGRTFILLILAVIICDKMA
jgi:hypothetical protein